MKSWLFKRFTPLLTLSATGLVAGSILYSKNKDYLERLIQGNKDWIEIKYNPRNKIQEKDAEMIHSIFRSSGIGVKIRSDSEDNSDKAQIYLKTLAGNAKVPRKSIREPLNFIHRKTKVKRAESLLDVASYLKQSNQGFFDSTIVCYYPDEDWDKFISNSNNKLAVESLLLNDANGFIRVASSKIAEKMKLVKGSFYKYYKPSFVNGYALIHNLNVEYWQIINGECRNLLTIKDGIFKEDHKVEFYFNKSYKKLLAQPRNGRPIVYVHWDKNSIIWFFMDQFTKLARKYDSDCDFVFSCDKSKSSKYFHMGEVDENVPYIFIVDPEKRIPVKSPFNEKEIGSYPTVYSEVVLLMFGVDEGSKILDKYFEGKLLHLPQSKRMYKPTLVKTLNKDSFETENYEQCLIQIYKHNCASCFYNAKSFDALSWKFKKYGIWDKLKLYKLRSDNDICHLGSFPYTPMYIYVKKGKEGILEIETLEPPQKFDLFKEQLAKASGLDLSMIKLDPKAQFDKYVKKEDKSENFDADFEINTTV